MLVDKLKKVVWTTKDFEGNESIYYKFEALKTDVTKLLVSAKSELERFVLYQKKFEDSIIETSKKKWTPSKFNKSERHRNIDVKISKYQYP